MARLSSKTSDTILSSCRAHVPLGPALRPPALTLAAAGRESSPGLLDEPGPSRGRLWELSPTLHCSIIGTCLTTGELRETLRRIARREGFAVATTSDHDLHSLAVRLAARRDGPGKLLHKTLDRRHAAAIRAFASAKEESALEAEWRDALAAGAVPGAYWAVLTHPFTTARLVRLAFGEVHMLSHLVGASNRADIRRLSALEAHNAQLQTELSAQRREWRRAVAERDRRLRHLEGQIHALSAARATPEPLPLPPQIAPAEGAAREKLADLETRLAKQLERRARVEERCREAWVRVASEREQRMAVEAEIQSLRAEANALQDQLRSLLGEPAAPPLHLGGSRVLVVGARPAQIAHWRALVERCAGELLHHDGGVDDNIAGLGGLVRRADIILLPADCVSHEAMWSAKRLAAQLGKPFRPMRTSSLAAFTRALHAIAAVRATDDGSRARAQPLGP
ncbi:MAG: DUF2325 domain-containing protein [Geminicoccaceae bacterium]